MQRNAWTKIQIQKSPPFSKMSTSSMLPMRLRSIHITYKRDYFFFFTSGEESVINHNHHQAYAFMCVCFFLFFVFVFDSPVLFQCTPGHSRSFSFPTHHSSSQSRSHTILCKTLTIYLNIYAFIFAPMPLRIILWKTKEILFHSFAHSNGVCWIGYIRVWYILYYYIYMRVGG